LQWCTEVWEHRTPGCQHKKCKLLQHHWLDSPVWTLTYFRSFSQSPAGCCFFSFHVTFFFPGWGCQPHAQTPATPEDQCFLSGLSPLAGRSQFGRSRTRFSPLHDLAVKTLPRSHDVDVQASDLVDSTHPAARCAPLGPHTTSSCFTVYKYQLSTSV
jgi:hypothetical protein